MSARARGRVPAVPRHVAWLRMAAEGPLVVGPATDLPVLAPTGPTDGDPFGLAVRAAAIDPRVARATPSSSGALHATPRPRGAPDRRGSMTSTPRPGRFEGLAASTRQHDFRVARVGKGRVKGAMCTGYCSDGGECIPAEARHHNLQPRHTGIPRANAWLKLQGVLGHARCDNRSLYRFFLPQ